MSRNVAEFHFCVQYAGHATKLLSYRTKTGQFIAIFGIWNRKRTESVRRFNRRFAHTLKLGTEPTFGSVPFFRYSTAITNIDHHELGRPAKRRHRPWRSSAQMRRELRAPEFSNRCVSSS